MRGKERRRIDWEWWSPLIFFVGIILFIFLGALYMVDKDNQKMECLKPIAIDYCEQEGMIYSSSYTTRFKCSVNERTIEDTQFRYSKEEIEECKRRIKE